MPQQPGRLTFNPGALLRRRLRQINVSILLPMKISKKPNLKFVCLYI